jgi:hypothetical protein
MITGWLLAEGFKDCVACLQEGLDCFAQLGHLGHLAHVHATGDLVEVIADPAKVGENAAQHDMICGWQATGAKAGIA